MERAVFEPYELVAVNRGVNLEAEREPVQGARLTFTSKSDTIPFACFIYLFGTREKVEEGRKVQDLLMSG